MTQGFDFLKYQAAIINHLRRQPVSWFRSADIFDAIDVENKTRQVFDLALADLAQAGKISSRKNGQGLEYAGAKTRADSLMEVVTEPKPPGVPGQKQEREVSALSRLPLTPKRQDRINLEQAIYDWLQQKPDRAYFKREIVDGVRLHMRVSGDIGYALALLVSAGKIHRIGQKNTTRYRIQPFAAEDEQQLRVAVATPADLRHLPPHIRDTVIELRERKDAIKHAIAYLLDLYRPEALAREKEMT